MKKTSFCSSFAVSALIMAFILSGIALMPFNQTTAFAAEQSEVRTAALCDIKVSFNTNESMLIQAYKIDGEYFVRARDITDRLNMNAKNHTKVVGINIYPYSPPESNTPLVKLTEKIIKVTLAEGYIYFDGLYIKGGCFLYKDEFYCKLTDLGRASQERLQGAIGVAKSRAKMPNPLEPSKTEFKSFSVTWNNDTKVFEVNNQVTNLVKTFEEERKIYFPSTPNTANSSASTSTTSQTEPRIVLPELSEAPEIGKTLANILFDAEKGTVDGNFTYPYTLHPLRGQCTWYAIGRFYEVFGLDLINKPKGNYLAGGFKDWIERAMSDECPDIVGLPYKGNGDLSNIPNRGLAVRSYHVIFIEYVERDENGYPTRIYYSEANAGHTGEKYKSGVFYPEIDGRVGSMTPESFMQRNGTFYGFITAK